MTDEYRHPDPKSRKLEEILGDVPAEEREELTRTWQIVGRVGQPSIGADEIEAAYAKISRRTASPAAGAWRRVASLAAMFVLGIATGAVVSRMGSTTEAIDERPQFMVLVRHQVDRAYTPSEHARLVADFTGWARRLVESGHYDGGHELADAGGEFRLVNGEPSMLDLDLTPASSSGYFLIRASDFDEAADVVKTCPFLDWGGTLELRRVMHQ